MLTVKKICIESWEKGIYHMDEQQMFSRACEYAQSRQSLYYSQTNSVDLEEASDKESCTWSYQMVAHEYLKNDKSDNQKTGPGFLSCRLFYYFHTSRRMHECSDKDIDFFSELPSIVKESFY